MSDYTPLLPGPEPKSPSDNTAGTSTSTSSSKIVWWLLGGLVVACLCIGAIGGAAIFAFRSAVTPTRVESIAPSPEVSTNSAEVVATPRPTRTPIRRATATAEASTGGTESAKQLLAEAYTALNANQADEAMAKVTQALAADPKLPGAHWLRGWLNLRFNEKPEDAMKDFEEVIKLDPDQGMGYSGRGQTYMVLKEFDKALDDLNAAIDKGAKDEWTYTYRAEARLNKLAAALNLSIDEAWLAMERDNKADIDAAIADLDSALTANDSFYFALDTRSFVHLKRQNYEDSLVDADKMVSLAPRYAQVYNTRSWLYANWGKGAEAVKDCEKALTMVQEDSAALLDTCGLAYYVSGDYKKALDFYNRALTAAPDQLDSVYRRGQTYQKLKNNKQAIADYQRYLKEGKSLELLEACKKALASLGVK